MVYRHRKTIMLAGIIALGAPLIAAEPTKQAGNPLRPLLDCRDLGDSTQRLACFDRESGLLDEASAKNEITVLDKESVTKARRSIFGLANIRLPFGGDDSEDEAAKELTSTIASVRSLGYGKWEFTLEDGARWATTDALTFGRPTVGREVVLKRASMGSYFATFEGARAVRSRRVN